MDGSRGEQRVLGQPVAVAVWEREALHWGLSVSEKEERSNVVVRAEAKRSH